MRTLKLLLLRHAEAEEAQGRSDRMRPLTRRGAQQAATIGAMLVAEGYAPDVMVTSDGARAHETAIAVAKALGREAELKIDSELYLGNLQDIENAIENMASEADTVMLVGHNPGFSTAALMLSEEPVELGTAEGVEVMIEADSWDEAFALSGDWTMLRVLTTAAR